MIEDYRSASVRAACLSANVARGQSPYLAVLDDILTDVDIVAQEPLGLVDIPAESIVGTKTAGRHTAFASNFMPLLDDDTEFAVKWSNLCDAHLEEGIHTPIIAFEYLNKFYVQEGNKRVSVLKYYEAVKIPGTVTRLIPAKNDTLENKLYYEFLDFYKFSRINYVSFSRLGGYAKLQTLACKATGEAWTDDDRLNFSSLYTMFSQQFYALGGGSLGLTPGDALLVYLSVYRYADACESTPTKVRENLARLWDEVKILAEPHAVELLLEPKRSSEPLLSKLNIFSSRPSELRVVFLHEHNAQTSAWVRGQDKGRAALVKAFPDKLYVSCRENVNPEVDAEQVLEEVAHDHVDIVFTTSARMHTACLKVAAQHPKTRFLNCSLNAPHPLVRTYYPRTYEVTYLLGMLAASSPTATRWAMWLQTRCTVCLRPSMPLLRACVPSGPTAGWCCAGPVCAMRHTRRISLTGKTSKSSTVRTSGSRKAPTAITPLPPPARRRSAAAGPAGVAVGRVLHRDRPLRVCRNMGQRPRRQGDQLLVGPQERCRAGGIPHPAERRHHAAAQDGRAPALRWGDTGFPTESYSQGHALHHAASGIYTPKELMEMDWLEECVEGELPSYDELDAKTRSLLNINGLDNVKGTPQ